MASSLALKAKPLYLLVENKFYIDEIYQAFFVTGLLGFTRLVLVGLVEFLGVERVGQVCQLDCA